MTPTVTAAPADRTTATAVPAADERAYRHFLGGARAMAPWLLGVTPFGLVIGISAAQADIPTAAGWLTGPLVFAGSAQVATIQLLDSGAAPLVVVAAALAVNLRLVLYSATMARHWRGTSPWWQGVAASVIVDPTVAVGVAGYEAAEGTGERRRAHLHFAGGAAILWAAWIAAITLGATVGAGLPPALRLELVIPLFLVGEVVPRLSGRITRRAVAAATVLAAAGGWVPLHLGALLAIGGGIATALLAREEDVR